MQEQNVLQGIREVNEAVRRNERELRSCVAAAREVGLSWQQIGSVLDVSKQAAWERFGKHDPHPARRRPPEED